MADVNASEFGPGYRYFLVHDGFGKEPFGVAREKDDIPDVDQWTDAGWVEAQWLSEYIANFGADAGSEEVTGDEAYQWVTHHSDEDSEEDSEKEPEKAPEKDSEPGASKKSEGEKPPPAGQGAVDSLRNKVAPKTTG